MADDAQRIGESNGSSGDHGGMLAQAMPSHKRRADPVLLQNPKSCHGASQDGRLRVGGQLKFLGRAFKTEPRKRKSKRVIGFRKGVPGDGEILSQIAAHARPLRSLARK